jgi:hypothetical protein
VSGANSYRGIQTYFKAHLRALNKAFKIKWRRAPVFRLPILTPFGVQR